MGGSKGVEALVQEGVLGLTLDGKKANWVVTEKAIMCEAWDKTRLEK